MGNIEHGTLITAIVLVIVFASGIAIVLGIIWMQQSTRNRAIDVLRIYAERGEEPPASVLDAVNRVHGPGVTCPEMQRPTTQGDHLVQVAGSAVIAAGAAGVVVWRSIVAPRDPDVMMIVAIIVAILFAGYAAARLAAAKTSGDGR